MSIYKITFTDDHSVEAISADQETEAVGGFAGFFNDQIVKSIPCKYITKPKKNRFEVVMLGAGKVLSERAHKIFMGIDPTSFISYPVFVNSEKWYAIEITNVLNVLDFKKTKFRMVGDSTYGVLNPVFSGSMPELPQFFDLVGPDTARYFTDYCSEGAKEVLLKAKIKGLALIELPTP